MSPDTPDPDRSAARPGVPDRPASADLAGPRPEGAAGSADPDAVPPAGESTAEPARLAGRHPGEAATGPARVAGPHAGEAAAVPAPEAGETTAAPEAREATAVPAPEAGEAPGSQDVPAAGGSRPAGDVWPGAGAPSPVGIGPVASPPEARRAAVTAVAAGAVLAVLGAPLGLLWTALAPDTPVIKTSEGAVYAQPQPEQPIAADGWFSLLGLGFGVLAAIALWFLLRRQRGPLGLVAGVLGAFAAGVVAWQVGRRIGLAEFDHLLATAPDGQAFGKPADLRAGGVDVVLGVLPVPHGNLLLPAFGAAVTYTLLAGWSRWPSLRPEPAPDVPGLSWASAATPAPPAAPEPPAPGAAGPTRD